MEFEDLTYEERGATAYITINRPKVYNAFRGQTVEEAILAFHQTKLDALILENYLILQVE